MTHQISMRALARAVQASRRAEEEYRYMHRHRWGGRVVYACGCVEETCTGPDGCGINRYLVVCEETETCQAADL